MKEAFEEWRDVVGYEGYYQVSNLGNVRSLDRFVECRGSMRFQKGRIMHPGSDGFGYKQVILHNKKGKLFKVHRLVAEAFIPNPDNLPVVNHKDEVKWNNNVENLEWCTVLYNLMYNDMNKRRNSKNRTNSIPVKQIKDGKVLNVYPSMREVTRVLNANSGNISLCCRGLRNSAYGYQWRYAESEDFNEKCV